MAGLFKQVQSTNSDEWLSYLKFLRHREVAKQTQGYRKWIDEADAFEQKIETREMERRIL